MSRGLHALLGLAVLFSLTTPVLALEPNVKEALENLSSQHPAIRLQSIGVLEKVSPEDASVPAQKLLSLATDDPDSKVTVVQKPLPPEL